MTKPATNLNLDEFYVLIAAAGSGQRFGGEKPKQYQEINGEAVLRHAIKAFWECKNVKAVHVVIDPSHDVFYKEAVKGLTLPPPSYGSDSRNKSIFNGLNFFSNLNYKDKILIHDAARPLIVKEDIMAVVSELDNCEAATLAVPVADTLRYGEDGYLMDKVERKDLWALQTPQGFHYGVLMDAYKNADPSKEYTDETNLVSECGVKVAIVHGHRQNFKITMPDDFELARLLLENGK